MIFLSSLFRVKEDKEGVEDVVESVLMPGGPLGVSLPKKKKKKSTKQTKNILWYLPVFLLLASFLKTKTKQRTEKT